MTYQDKLARAKQRVEAITGFYIHLGIFVVVMMMLVVIDAMTGPGWWVQWPFLGWGIGILAHAAAVFGTRPQSIFGRMQQRITTWQLRKIRELSSKA